LPQTHRTHFQNQEEESDEESGEEEQEEEQVFSKRTLNVLATIASRLRLHDNQVSLS
jgi:hypothetical protein